TSFGIRERSHQAPDTAVYPLPVPDLSVFLAGSPHSGSPGKALSAGMKESLIAKVLHVVVMSLNYLHSDLRHVPVSSLRRQPNTTQLQIFARLRELDQHLAAVGLTTLPYPREREVQGFIPHASEGDGAWPLADFLGNGLEGRLVGPWKTLPPGHMLTAITIPPGYCAIGASTDRADFYHQALISMEALALARKIVRECEARGQGESELQVELARARHRLLAKRPPGRLGPWEALVIDDFFVVSAEKASIPPERSEATQRVLRAKEVYKAAQVKGSDHKDVLGAQVFQAAGAQIDSSALT
ncbi:unnamed protein product, partial [Symbiodinium microadriaticum]